MSERELIEELIKLQISQTATLTRLLEANLNRTEQQADNTTSTPSAPPWTQDDRNRPLEIGDSVTVVTAGRFGIRKDTVCTIVKIGKRVTIETPTGTQTNRAAHNLRRVRR
jgi:hypothetical protein